MNDWIPQVVGTPEAMPFLRWVQNQITTLQNANVQRTQADNNVAKGQNAVIANLGTNLGNLSARLAAAISNLTFDASAVISGVFALARIPGLPASQITSGTLGVDSNTANLTGVSVFASNAGVVAGNISGTRTQIWARNSDGYIGNTLSSQVFKQDITDAVIDPVAVLSIGIKHYRYIAEVRRRDDPTYEFYVGPDYHVALEVGMIAEDLHAAGLWQFVVYKHEFVYIDDDGNETVPDADSDPVLTERLVLDTHGRVIPQSIHYGLWAMAVHVATKHVWLEHLRVRADTDLILAHLDLATAA